MGRKIPAKKHRGVKDPLQQQARRLQSIKSKINAPPKDPDEQPVPRSLTQLFAFQNKHKTEQKANKKRDVQQLPHSKDNRLSGVGDNPIARLRKLPGETGRGFSLRINSAIKALHDPSEQDYLQDLEADDVKGERMAEQRERRARKRRKAARAGAGAGARAAPGAGAGAAGEEPQLGRRQRLALKQKAKKERVAEAREESRELVYERVAFGDVTHAPPALPAPPGAAPRPGRRQLLLSALLPGGAAGAGAGGAGGPPGGAADRARRERARLDAVAAYRTLKANKLKRLIK